MRYESTASPSWLGRARALLDWTFRNRRTGRMTIVQFPNVELGIVLAAAVVRGLVHLTDAPRTVLDVVAGVALAGWAVDEIIRGVNPWRRFLGAAVLGSFVLSQVA